MSDLTPRDGSFLIHPGTGEVLDLARPAPDLLAVKRALEALEQEAAAVRREVERELVRRVDRAGKRTAVIDGAKLKVNAPTEDHYDAGELEAALIAAGFTEEAAAAIVQPPPKAPPAKVDKRVVNNYLNGSDHELVAVIERVRRRAATSRKLDVLSVPVDSTAEEA